VYPAALADAHVPWLNGGATGAATPGVTKLGHEGGCACDSDHWDAVLFCSDCAYGYGPRGTTDFAADVCSASLADGGGGGARAVNCSAPYGLDPVLASPTDAYKLCAGHGTWSGGDGTDAPCACFRDDARGHWALAKEDGAATHTCRVCASPARGPKPGTVADEASRLLGMGVDAADAYGGTCRDKPQQACARVGQYDPDLAFTAEEEDAEATWKQCAGHGAWNGTGCACATGWRLAPNDPLFGGAAYDSCNRCAVGFGPAVPDVSLVEWDAAVRACAEDGATDCGTAPPFCVGPWAPDPLNRTLVGLCALHGDVVPRASVLEDYGKPCRCWAGPATGYWNKSAGSLVCDVCRDGWGPAPRGDGAPLACFARVGPDV
jgi:hypothetical protein